MTFVSLILVRRDIRLQTCPTLCLEVERIPKHREDVLLRLLSGVANGELKGERLMAYDVSALGSSRAINIEDDEGRRVTIDAWLSDLEGLAHEGYLEADYQGPTLHIVVLHEAWKYRDTLRTIEIAKGQEPRSEPR